MSGRLLFLAPALLVIGGLAVAPLLLTAVNSVQLPAIYGGVEPGFSLDSYAQLLVQRDIFTGKLAFSLDYLLILWRSVILAAGTTLICLVLGLPMAWFIVTRPPRWRAAWILAVTIPFWTSLLVRALALVVMVGDAGLMNGMLLQMGVISRPLSMLYTDGAVLLGLVYASLPFMVLPIYAVLERLDRRLIEAAADLYADRWAILARILWPLARPGVTSGSILVFVPALGSYVIPLVLGGGKSMLIGDLIALQFGSARNWPLGSALSVTLTLGVGLAYLATARLEKAP